MKRFIYTDRLVKLKDYVNFDEVLEIGDEIVSPSLRCGIFNTTAQKPKYRLFSVVEHIGTQATSGHYISHTMDSDDRWKCFDDQKILSRELSTILDSQAYILFYELI